MGSHNAIECLMQIEIEKPEWCNKINVCDTSTQCVHCGCEMAPEHAHYRCHNCGNRDACCEGVY